MWILTGANEGYFRCLLQFLRSAVSTGADRIHRMLIFDLGLSTDQLRTLETRFPQMTVERFPFEEYPDHFRMRHGSFAWKPTIIADVASRVGEPVFWLDSATVLLGSLDAVTHSVDRSGLYTPYGGGGASAVHSGMIAYCDALGISRRWLGLRARAGGVCAFDPSRPRVHALLQRWKELAGVVECIAPSGANASNHKYDAAILTMLLYQAQHDGDLVLTRDEIDISASHPIDFLMTRVWVHDRIPLAFQPVVVAAFRLYRRLDAFLWRLKRRGKPAPPPDHPIR